MEEYKGERPGCFKCKQKISPDEDYYRLTWVGKTWEITADYHLNCFIEAVKAGEIRGDLRGVRSELQRH